MRTAVYVLVLFALPALAAAQPPANPTFLDRAKQAFDIVTGKSVRFTLEPVAPTAGITGGVALKPKDWRHDWGVTSLHARASYSQNKYWAVDGNYAWQSRGGWRIEPYIRARQMTRLNHFGIGNDTPQAQKSDFSMREARGGVSGYLRPVGWLAVGGRADVLGAHTGEGENPLLPSVAVQLSPADLAGFRQDTTFTTVGGFVNLNYPYVRSERPRRGGDYMVSIGRVSDRSGTGHSFTRLELEGAERFPVAGPDRLLVVHGRLSSSRAAAGQTVPFYLMDTLGGSDNLRGFKESIIGLEETTATLRTVENFRFRDTSTLLFQAEFRQRIWSQVFASVFVDAGAVAPTVRRLGNARMHRGVGVGVGVYRANALMIRTELSVWGGEGHPSYLVTGRGLSF
jgi:hypothetical protein